VPSTRGPNIRQMGEVDDAGVSDAAPMSDASGPRAEDGAVSDHRRVGHLTTSPAGIVAFVFTDLEDSTRRWEEDPEAMKADVARHLALIDDVVARHGGRRALEQGAGDSTVAAFTRASDALAVAVALQTAMHQATWQGSDPLRVRVAVHAGEVDVDHRGGYVGPTMNRCGRLLQASHGGQVLASATVVELGRAGLGGSTLRELGVHHLRGIDEPVAIVQVSGAGLPDSFPPVRTQEGAARTVPLPDSSFVGRRADIDAVASLVAAQRVVTVVGAGGCGKTRLAIEVSNEVLGSFRDGVVWVDLAPVSGAAAVLDATASALGMRGTVAPTAARIAAHLTRRSVLLVVDNCEHVIDAAAALVAAIEASAPEARVLATSREPLALKDEVVWRVPSLAVPVHDDGRDLLDTDAGRLLVARIRRVRPATRPAATTWPPWRASAAGSTGSRSPSSWPRHVAPRSLRWSWRPGSPSASPCWAERDAT
jgi:class 3 adenylate cyclase